MNITIELIDEMRKRTNCSYQEAKELLKKNNGDLIEAIIELEKSRPHRSHHHRNKNCNFKTTTKKLIDKGSTTYFKIEKNKETFLNIPVIILGIIVLITMPFFWLYLILALILYLMGYKIRIKKDAGRTIEVQEIIADLGSKFKTVAKKINEKDDEETNENQNCEDKDDDENEIIIQ